MKIVSTGYGVVAPKTKDVNEFLKNLQEGTCVLDLVPNLGPKGESNIHAAIEDIASNMDHEKTYKRLPRIAKIGINAAKEAVSSAGIDVKQDKVGLFFGTSLGSTGEQSFQQGVVHSNNNNYKKMPPTFTHYANYHSITASIGHAIGANGVTKTLSTGCTAGIEAMEEAMAYLKSGMLDVAIVGGADSVNSQATIYAFAKTSVLPLDQSLENGAVPFHEDSKGFAMGEAGGFVVLEREDHALERGVTIRGEIVDIASNNDGISIFSVDETGEQMGKVMRQVTEGRNPDYVNTQALGIQTNDRVEEKTSRHLFNHQVPYSSIKAMYGNPFCATGVLQIISSLLSLEHNFIPPTIRTTKKGYEDMNIVTETVYKSVNEVAISNHGLGGNNVGAYIKKHY